MGLETIIRLILGGLLYAIFGFVFNRFIYFYGFAVSLLYGSIYFVLNMLGLSTMFSLGIKVIGLILFVYPIFYIIKLFTKG